MESKYSFQMQSQKDNKFIFVCGGGMSGLGKGITTSSIGLLLKECGYQISVIKIDPYLNVDAGTMSPYEHGEVFILDDGGEADLDLGNYERFLDLKLSSKNNITSGKIYESVLKQERQGLYLGKTVQVVPHVTDRIKKWIHEVARIPVDLKKQQQPEIVLVEVGGTVGDIESMSYYEAIRQMINENAENICLIFLTYVPTIGASGEQKTKFTQQGIKELRHTGLWPDIMICRTTDKLTQENLDKLSMFSSIKKQNIISNQDVDHLYQVPLVLNEQNIIKSVCNKLNLEFKQPNLDSIQNYITFSKSLRQQDEVKICIVGKYTQCKDAYMSLIKSLENAGVESEINLKLIFIEAEQLELNEQSTEFIETFKILQSCSGILVPGGFGSRGVEGKIIAINYARVNKIPFFGICLGFQAAAIEYARNVMNIKNAHSQEFSDVYDESKHVVMFMPDSSLNVLGGTMRLGSKNTRILSEDSLAYKIYGQENVHERHRHRYEINPKFINQFQESGLLFSGIDINKEEPRMIILEIQEEHPFYFAVQYHPEMINTIDKPSKSILAFVLASANKFQSRLQMGNGILNYINNWNHKQSI